MNVTTLGKSPHNPISLYDPFPAKNRIKTNMIQSSDKSISINEDIHKSYPMKNELLDFNSHFQITQRSPAPHK